MVTLLTMIFAKKNFLIFFYILVIGTSGYKFSFSDNFLEIVENFLKINDAHAQSSNALMQFQQ